MRPTLFFFFACFAFLTASGQVANEYRSNSPRMIAYGKLPENDADETVQSNFLEQKWSPGWVRFRNNETREVPLIFDVYNNQLYFQENGQIMEFLAPIEEFTLKLVQKNDSVLFWFRSFYPAVDKNTQETFYQVLVDGPFQLLKCKAKTIHLYKDENVPEEKRDYSKELFYAFLPNNQIVSIQKDKESILKQMPAYAQQVNAVIDNEKLKIKNEKSLTRLFQLLNEQ